MRTTLALIPAVLITALVASVVGLPAVHLTAALTFALMGAAGVAIGKAMLS